MADNGAAGTAGLLRTAESVTKSLRAKSTPVEDIVRVSNSLLDDELNVYLPNAVSFVFDLLVDRLNDKKQVKYRASTQVWQLFNKAWLQLEAKVRNRSFKSFRFGECVADALTRLSSDGETISTITQTLNLVRLSSLVNAQEHAVEILDSYIKLVRKSVKEQDIKDIVSFFRASMSIEKYTPKFITSFVASALPSILDILDSPGSEPLLAVIKRTVLSKDSLVNLRHNVDILLEQDVSGNSLIYFYSMVVDTLSKSDIDTLEHIYSKIVALHPETSGRLLGYITETKRTLSPAFLLQVFDAEFSKEEQDWKLIHSVLKLDIEIGTKNGEQIMRALQSQSFDGYIAVGEEIIDAHIRARELGAFFQLWTKLLSTDTKWGAAEFCQVVSKSIPMLSATQLKVLAEDLLSNTLSSKYTALTAVLQGLFSVRDKMILKQAKDIFKPVFLIEEGSDDLWLLRYQLLCLFEDIVSTEELAALAKPKPKSATLYHFYTLFRIRELIPFETKYLVKYFMKFVKSNHGDSLLQMLFERWFVIVNEIFPQDHIDLLVSFLLNADAIAIGVLDNSHLLEQPNITESLIIQISASIKETSSVSELHISILRMIPIQCYPRRVKVPLLNTLTGRYLKVKDMDFGVIQHILQTPTFKSGIESDIDTISAVVSRDPKSSLFITLWEHRASNLKDVANLKFLQSLANHVMEGLTSANGLSVYMFMAHSILSSPVDGVDISGLKDAFIENSRTLLTGYSNKPKKNIQNTSWLLGVLYELDISQTEFSQLCPVLVKFGDQIQRSGHIETMSSLFLLFTKYKVGSFGYLQSLYIVLRQLGVRRDQLTDGLSRLLSDVENDQFTQSFYEVIGSIDQEYQEYVLEIVKCYWTSIQRSNEHAQSIFVKCLSILASHLGAMTSDFRISVFHSLRALLVEKTWIITQYGLELIIAVLTIAADQLSLDDSLAEECFTSISMCMSNILLFHRYRLSNRHHIVLSFFTSLLRALTKQKTNSLLQKSKVAAESYQRLLSNLCEPPQVKESHSNSLSSGTSDIKRALRKHLHVLLMTYVHLALKFSFEAEVREALLAGVFGIFDVLSDSELQLVSTSLDYSGRVYYRTLYDEYKKVGKWQTN